MVRLPSCLSWQFLADVRIFRIVSVAGGVFTVSRYIARVLLHPESHV